MHFPHITKGFFHDVQYGELSVEKLRKFGRLMNRRSARLTKISCDKDLFYSGHL